jgi:hypothetical protein
MYVEPENDWHLDDDNFDMTQLNFTFNCTKFYNSTLLGI